MKITLIYINVLSTFFIFNFIHLNGYSAVLNKTDGQPNRKFFIATMRELPEYKIYFNRIQPKQVQK